ncbi:MAG: 4-alpha-glucanotransferase [Gammaproteobacteria bacterium]|nr:4-alpha-glucanotransferase [Gammaproteobacteria bacterium]
MHDTKTPREAGALLHITSLPSGRFDDDALRWVDWLAEAGLSVWQMLPLVIPDSNGSPYQSASAFATNPALLPLTEVPVNESAFAEYCANEAYWLDDFAAYSLLKQELGEATWIDWPDVYRRRDDRAMAVFSQRHDRELLSIKETQYRLDRAWHRIRQHAADRCVRLFGDIPIFVAHDSADTWAQPEDFLLDEDGHPTFVTGVPPDYFSATGQRWGNPHYRWEFMQRDGFQWWSDRMRRQGELFDIVRIDHFRGLVAVWMIDAECDTAIEGYWENTPGEALLTVLKNRFPELSIVAEDLGVITDEVRELRHRFALPGMSVLQFAFDSFDDNPHKPANITPDTVVYTGTHDNDTCVGWFSTLKPHEQAFVFEVLGSPPTDDIAGLMVRTGLQTAAGLAMAPLQDYLGLDGSARMNTPGVSDGNWQWRFDWDMLDSKLTARLREMISTSGRQHGS